MYGCKDIYDLIIIGGGPAGLAAACAARDSGLERILIIERDIQLGGILNQCIHSGFGLHTFGEELTGPEFAGKYIDRIQGGGIECRLNTTVLDLNSRLEVHAASSDEGYSIFRAKSIILAMGCRERARGSLCIPGTRPAGVYTAGTAQRYLNTEGCLVGKRVLIVGSGDIGLIMARRMSLSGAKVLGCVEIMPYSNGLPRNISQCLNDFGIPLYLSHTLIEIKGKERVESAVAAAVDEKGEPIPGSEIIFDCDTILFSVGLIPENELSRKAGVELDRASGSILLYDNMETSVPGIFACGNVAHVHDLADFAAEEAVRAGQAAAQFVKYGAGEYSRVISVKGGENVSYIVPCRIRAGENPGPAELRFRVKKPCGAGIIRASCGGRELASVRRRKFSPGSTECIKIPAAALKEARGSIDISVEEVSL